MLNSLLCLLFAASASASTANYSDCPTRLSTLEQALYETEDNIFHLNTIFFPRSSRTSRFIRVIYSFQDDPELLENDSSCKNVAYIWAIGSFLFFQPPAVFFFTSLYFNYPNNDLNDLTLILPHECRPLVFSSETGRCACREDDPRSDPLDVLTQQVSTIFFRWSL